MTTIQTKLGARIKARLQDRTQSWLADELGLSNEAVSKWIKGKAGPTLSNLRELARVLDCSVGYLAGDQDDEATAEVVRIMTGLTPDGKQAISAAVIGMAAALPATMKLQQRKRA